jgi:hypothetical protein
MRSPKYREEHLINYFATIPSISLMPQVAEEFAARILEDLGDQVSFWYKGANYALISNKWDIPIKLKPVNKKWEVSASLKVNL